MTIEIRVPNLPESVTDATVAKWYKKIGSSINRDENLVDLETDKVMLEVPAPHSGVIEKILVPEGQTVKAGELLATINENSGAAAVATPTAPTSTPAPAPSVAATKAAAPTTKPSAFLSPSARRAATESGVTKKEESVPVSTPMGNRSERRVPLSRLRARIAERLVQVQHEAAILTSFNEINMAPVMALRQKYRDSFEKEFGVRLGFMSFFAKATIEALKKFPAVNASLDENELVYHNFYDIGIAVGTERGLVVPILRNAELLSMAEIELKIREFAEKAKNNKLAMEEMTGGTFTITNGGTYGSMLSTPIINPPQTAILGMHNIVERAVVEEGTIVARPMMYVALSYDHRVIDGREAVLFLKTIKECLEDPARMLLSL